MIIIIGILAAIAIPMFLNQRNKAKDAAVKEGIHSIQVGIQSYAVDHSDTYPARRGHAYSSSTSPATSYVDNWPKNPCVQRSLMADTTSVRRLTYTSSPAINTFTLVGHLSNSGSVLHGPVIAPGARCTPASRGGFSRRRAAPRRRLRRARPAPRLTFGCRFPLGLCASGAD